MASNEYHFVTLWRLEGTCEEVSAILGDAPGLPRWWPSVYLSVRELAPGGPGGIGRRIDLHTKGWLPYTLRWEFVTTESRPPHRIALAARGDFVGEGVWTFRQDGPVVDVVYEWTVRAEKPLLRRLSLLLKPVFSMNHRWAMRMGERSLALELRRRRARTEAERAAIPAPPPPTTTSSLPLLAGAAAVAALVALAWRALP